MTSGGTNPITQEDIKKSRAQVCEFEGCRRKIGLTGYPCYCDKYFCPLHIPAEVHHCQFDYKEAAKEKLTEEMQKVEAEKIKKL